MREEDFAESLDDDSVLDTAWSIVSKRHKTKEAARFAAMTHGNHAVELWGIVRLADLTVKAWKAANTPVAEPCSMHEELNQLSLDLDWLKGKLRRSIEKRKVK